MPRVQRHIRTSEGPSRHHALHWFFTSSDQLSTRARETLFEAEREEPGGVGVSVASCFDLHYLVASRKLPQALAAQLWAVTTYPDVNVEAVPMSADIAETAVSADLTTLRDPWDRIITATAIVHDLPLVSAYSAMQGLADQGLVNVIW